MSEKIAIMETLDNLADSDKAAQPELICAVRISFERNPQAVTAEIAAFLISRDLGEIRRAARFLKTVFLQNASLGWHFMMEVRKQSQLAYNILVEQDSNFRL